MFQSSPLESERSKSAFLNISKLIIDQKYILKRIVNKIEDYYVCEGIALNTLKSVLIYLKPENSPLHFSKKIKEELRDKVSPKIVWSGNYRIQKNKWNIQIHQKNGPTLKAMFNYIKKSISTRDFLLLMFHLIRLVEKYANVGYVYRELNMNNISFDTVPERNQLFLVNVFPLKKKGEETCALNTRFCSKGAHLGLKPFIKDDLQSVCYILLNFHTQDEFLRNVQSDQYLSCKTNIDFDSFKDIPPLFIEFYNYVMNLNYNDEVNFFKWRNIIYYMIGKESMIRPYEWLSKESITTNKDQAQIENEIRPEDQRINDKIKTLKVLDRVI